MYRKGVGRRTRDNAKRETGWRYARREGVGEGWGRVDNVGGSDQKRRAISGGCSLSPRIVRRCRCFSLFLYLVVPFPNFTLQIPLLTLTKVDAVVIHLANLLQLHYKEYGESLSEIVGSSICLLFWQLRRRIGYRWSERRTALSVRDRNVRDAWCEKAIKSSTNLASRKRVKIIGILRVHLAFCRSKLNAWDVMMKILHCTWQLVVNLLEIFGNL